MASLDKHPVFYASFTVVNNGPTTPLLDSDDIEASVLQQYPSPIINKASDYVCSVERMEININGIPFYDATGESVSYTDASSFDLVDFESIRAYSLADLTVQLQARFAGSTQIAYNRLDIVVSSDGFVILTQSPTGGLTWTSTFGQLDLSQAPRLNNILGFHSMVAVPTSVADVEQVISTAPRMDCGDQLAFLRLTSNLPTVSESIGQAKGSVLTDFYISKNIGSSVSYANLVPEAPTFAGATLSYSQRQKVIYNPQVRRFLHMRGSRPIDEILIACEFVRPDGTSKIVPLPLGCEFTVKLGFWNLLNDQTPKDSNFQSKIIGGQEMVVF